MPGVIVIPRGRTAAEKRLGAIAALHSPVVDGHDLFVNGHDFSSRKLVCPECSDRYEKTAWPCATARLMGPWPGELPEDLR